ncbi:MAG: family 10 glycosylhydrolase [Chitinophagaceae bacterium]
MKICNAVQLPSAPRYLQWKPFRLCLGLLLMMPTAHAQKISEFRGVWVASVDNIDWPAKGNYNADSQKIAFIQLLDMHKANGMNALVVQIRPATDAFYPSPYEPWSEWLTGKQGRPPVPYYDPLAFMITETHKRGMEFHAWMNPYRAVFNTSRSSIAATHISRLHPDWFITYGDKLYFDPGNKEVQQYVTNVVKDVVSRYAVDAIHFDDYFYPYRIPGKEFPDNDKYLLYGKGMNKDDWRRSNVDSIILMLSKAIKKENKKCQFGISPFGVWRNIDKDPDGSNTKAGQTNYDDLYADILLWLKMGWIDYVAPQLYWEFGHKAAPYEVLIDWWNKHSYGKNCYIGLGIYRAGSNEAWKDKNQIPRQIQLLRQSANIQGMIFFSSKSFNKNPNGWNDSLRLNYFASPAQLPNPLKK